MHPSVPICLCMVYLLGLRLTVVFSKRFGYTTFREKPPLVAKIAVFAVLPCLPLFTSGVNGDHPLCAVVSKTTFRATSSPSIGYNLGEVLFYHQKAQKPCNHGASEPFSF